MKKSSLSISAVIFYLAFKLIAQEAAVIKLLPPNTSRGLPFMQTLAVKASAREFSEKELSLQDLSDLLWAANGLNRPSEKKTTASSALNAHDVDIYVFMKEGVYIYDFIEHQLNLVLSGDHRSEIMMQRPPRPEGHPTGKEGNPPGESTKIPPPPSSNPPIQIILVSDSERFRMGSPELRYEWGAIDAGIVSQNISLFCAATGLKTRPRASMDKEKIKTLLNLKDTHYVLLNHPVGYEKNE